MHMNPNHPYFMHPQQYLTQQQAAFLEKVSPYERTNFYDTISSNSSSMRPPPKMGVNSLQGRPNGYPNQNRNAYQRKQYSCGNERYYGNEIIGKTSFNSSVDKIEDVPRVAEREMKQGGNENEPTPEWYTNPATVDDVVDLRGFEEGDGDNQQPQAKPNPVLEKGYGTPSLAYRRSGYNQNRNNNNVRYGFNNNNNNNGFNNGSGNYNNAQNGNQRFRNPLHFQKRKFNKFCRF